MSVLLHKFFFRIFFFHLWRYALARGFDSILILEIDQKDNNSCFSYVYDVVSYLNSNCESGNDSKIFFDVQNTYRQMNESVLGD